MRIGVIDCGILGIFRRRRKTNYPLKHSQRLPMEMTKPPCIYTPIVFGLSFLQNLLYLSLHPSWISVPLVQKWGFLNKKQLFWFQKTSVLGSFSLAAKCNPSVSLCSKVKPSKKYTEQKKANGTVGWVGSSLLRGLPSGSCEERFATIHSAPRKPPHICHGLGTRDWCQAYGPTERQPPPPPQILRSYWGHVRTECPGGS